MRSWLTEFREFILRGNLVDLAVAFVIGVAFTAVVNALVADLVTPIIAAVGGEPNFSDLAFTINGSQFRYGHFINQLITFLTIAATVFFFVVKAVNALLERLRPERAVDELTRACPECMRDIPVAARRCSFCTAVVGPGVPA